MDVINLKAIDNMIRLGDKYSESTLSYPATLFQIYQNICSHNNLTPATTNFPNKDYVVQEKPEGDYTFRDILGFVAELSGTFAKFNRLGHLELKWYEFAGLEISPDIRYNFKVSDEVIGITGITFTIEGEDEEEDIVYITGTEDYAIDISDNPLLQSDYEIVLPNILNNVEGTIFRPYETEWFGNPAIDSGDMVIHETLSGELINTIITTSTFNYGRKSKMYAKATPTVKKGFEGSTSKKLNQIVRKIRQQDREYNDKLTDLESAQLNAMELMANMLGGHLIIDSEGGNIYIANSPNIQDATEYWQWGLGGFVHYKDGVIDTGVTADGSIVAYLVNAGIVTADMVKTGILQSQDGQTWINLNNGYFNLGNIKYDQNGFKILVHDRTLEDSLDEKINRGDLSVSAENRLYQSKTEIPLRFNEGYSGELQLFRNAFHPYYKVTSSGNGISLFGNFPNSQYAEDLSGEEVTISLDISADENGTIEIDGEEFDLVENKWTRVYVTKIFPSTNTSNIRVRTLYSKGHSRDIVYGNNLIDNLATDLNLIYYRNLQVQKGKIPTVHTLTPEEIEEYNERNKSEIKQLVDSISMMVKKDELSTEVIQNAESWGLSINGKLKGQNYEFNVDNFRIGGESGDRVEHDNQKSRYIHSDGSYTQIDASGLKRYVGSTGHEYNYLVHVGEIRVDIVEVVNEVVITLPNEFMGKEFNAFASIARFSLPPDYILRDVRIYIAQKDYVNNRLRLHASLWSWKVNTHLGSIRSGGTEWITGYWLESEQTSFTNVLCCNNILDSVVGGDEMYDINEHSNSMTIFFSKSSEK